MITMLSDHIQSKSLLKNGTDELVNELWKVKYTKNTSKDSGLYGAAMKMIKLTIKDNKNDKEFIRKASVEGMSQHKINDGLNAIIKQVFAKMDSFDGKKGRKETVLALGKRAKTHFDTDKGKSEYPAAMQGSNQHTLFQSFHAPTPT